jgi:hypothetical protein
MEKNAAKLIKGNGRLAPIITAQHLDESIDRAKQQGIYAFGIYDSTYNDFFEVFGNKDAWKQFEVQIFNRWGEKVYQSADMNLMGKMAQETQGLNKKPQQYQ